MKTRSYVKLTENFEIAERTRLQDFKAWGWTEQIEGVLWQQEGGPERQLRHHKLYEQLAEHEKPRAHVDSDDGPMARLMCKIMWAVPCCDSEEFKNSEHFIFNVYASDRLSIDKHWSPPAHSCGNPPNRLILFVEVTTFPFASVGQGLTSCGDFLRMCHCHHCHCRCAPIDGHTLVRGWATSSTTRWM